MDLYIKMKENILISACLLGVACRYDGRSVKYPEIEEKLKEYNLIPFCCECAGGLPTPRVPSERVSDRVFMKDGTDVTDFFILGAKKGLSVCREHNIKKAVLKARSPSCGKGRIYDGSFSGRLTDADGVLAEFLIASGITVYTEEELDSIIN